MIQNPKTVCCRLSDEEWNAFQRMCMSHKVTAQVILRAIVIDALAEEEDALRRREPEGYSGSGEESEDCGATTP